MQFVCNLFINKKNRNQMKNSEKNLQLPPHYEKVPTLVCLAKQNFYGFQITTALIH